MKRVRKKTTVVVVGHGSRVGQANADFEAFVDRFRGYVPGHDLIPSYIELAQPDATTALKQAALTSDRVFVLPLFLFAAGHVKNDLPLAVAAARREFPDVKFDVAPPLGVHPNMVRLAAARIDETAQSFDKEKGGTAVLMIGRGCSDSDANSDFCKLVRLIEETSSCARVDYCFVAIVKPKVTDALERLLRDAPDAVILQPYLLFPGRLVQQIEELIVPYVKRYPGISIKVSRTLGESPLIFDLLKERLAGAVSGGKLLPCDNCQYRVPSNLLQDKVGWR